MKPLYKKENSEITIRRGPEDIIWFCVFVYIMAVLFEAMILMTGISLLKVIILLINPALSICLCKFTAKRYENTWVRITEEKIIFNSAGKTKEIELNNLEETQECLKSLAEKHSNIGFNYSIHKVGKGYENWGSVVMPENKSFSGLISAKRYGQIFSYNFIEYCEFYIKSCKGENEWDEISHIGKDGRL